MLPTTRLVLDARGIPTGREEPVARFDGQLASKVLMTVSFSLPCPGLFAPAGGGRQITLEFLEGYPYAQVFAPANKDFIAIEPMTAPANVLVSGRGLCVASRAKIPCPFRIGVEGIHV